MNSKPRYIVVDKGDHGIHWAGHSSETPTGWSVYPKKLDVFKQLRVATKVAHSNGGVVIPYGKERVEQLFKERLKVGKA